MTVEQLMKFVVSGGIVVPDNINIISLEGGKPAAKE
jgi:uncharacterized membrane protein